MYTANFTPPTAEYTYTATYTDTPDTITKYLQLTTLLQALRGGYGGNGGYGGGYSGSTGRQASVGIGGAGRQNLGGFGGGGSGGTTNGSVRAGGIGGSILYAEIGRGYPQTPYLDMYCVGELHLAGINGQSGGGGSGTLLGTSYFGGFGKGGICYGGGGGGSGGAINDNQNQPADSQYAGGFVLFIVKGNVSGTGSSVKLFAPTTFEARIV
jgi:hypothetical protein